MKEELVLGNLYHAPQALKQTDNPETQFLICSSCSAWICSSCRNSNPSGDLSASAKSLGQQKAFDFVYRLTTGLGRSNRRCNIDEEPRSLLISDFTSKVMFVRLLVMFLR